MLKKHFYLGLFLLLLAACGGPQNEVQLVERSFGDEVPVQGNLGFTFNQEMIADTFLNRWDSVAYISFDPPIPGRFSWHTSQELVFAPFQTLSPATTYKATLTDALTSHKDELKLGKERTFEFATPSLSVTQLNSYWAERDQGKERYFLHLDLLFNYAIESQKLQSVLKLAIDGKEQAFKMVKDETNNAQTVYLHELPMSDENLELEVEIGKTLVPFEGTNPMAAAHEAELQIASPFQLTIHQVTAQHDGAEGELLIATSQEVKAQDIRRFLSLSPSVKYEVKISPKEIRLVSEEFDVNQRYELTVKENLRGVLGGQLKGSYTEQVSFGKLRPSIRFRDQQSVYLTTQGSQVIEAEIVNVPKVKLKVTKVYANNIQSFLGSGYYYYEYREDYDNYYYSPNYEYYRSRQLGDLVHEEELQTMSLPLSGNQRLLKLDFEDKIPDYPGFTSLNSRPTILIIFPTGR